jgi:HAD superfamily hydrolase (TIGR01484 family)
VVQKPKLVACDVDGTLLGPMAVASRRTIDIIANVVAAGVPFVLVTGRPPRWIPPVVDEIGHAGLAVCANGAVLYDAAADRVLSSATLDPLLLNDIADLLDSALPGCMLAVERAGETADSTGHDFLAESGYLHPWPSPLSVHAPRAEVLGHPATKLLVRHPDMTSEAMMTAAGAVLGELAGMTFSTGNGLLELSAAEVTKGSGLAAVAREHGVRQQDVIAFGDMPNDLSMLAWAGHGVAMANGHPSVLQVADEVTAPNVEDGVALVLERWFSA